MHTRLSLSSLFALCGSLGALFLAPAVRAQNNPPLQYHVVEIIPKLLNEPPIYSSYQSPAYTAMLPVAVNNRGYILYPYYAASSDPSDPYSDYYNNFPLVYLGNGRTVLLPATGLNVAPQSSTDPRFKNFVLSDVAADGSFRVAASYPSLDADGGTRRRPVVWQVDAAGTPSNPQPLQNIVLPPDSNSPGEQGSGYPTAVNSAGKVVGAGNSYLVELPLIWNLPSTTPNKAPDPIVSLSSVDELGNIVGYSYYSDENNLQCPTFNGADIPVPHAPGLNHPAGHASSVNNGYAAGSYDPNFDPNASEPDASSVGFVYKDGVATTLPYNEHIPTSVNKERSHVDIDHVNSRGDAIGIDFYLPSGPNRTLSTLWTRQSDGTYLEYPVLELQLSQPAGSPMMDLYDADAVGIAEDGSLIVTNVNLYDSTATYGRYSVTVILKPGAGTTHPAFFNGEAALDNGVYYLSFPNGNYFGYYSYLDDPKYIYHFDMGYEYLFDAADGNAGVYLYDFKSSTFFYTSPTFPFPYLYDFSLNTFLYYYPDPKNAGHYNTDGFRFFYRFDNGKIIVK